MGNRFSARADPLCVLMLGLDAAGKTTSLYALQVGEIVTTIPTIGFNVETCETPEMRFTCWDVGGRDKIRPLWRHYFQNQKAIVWVVDSSDVDREKDTMEELHKTMAATELKSAVLVVFANKQDLPGAMSPEEVADRLGLFHPAIKDRRWHIQGSCATTGDGLHEGFSWLASQFKECPPPAFSLSAAALDEPGHCTATCKVLVWDRPGGCQIKGTIQANSALAILEVSSDSSSSALTHGRIEEPVSGWISVHRSQVSANAFVVTLHPKLNEKGVKAISCLTMGGDELASLELQSVKLQTLPELKQHIGKAAGKDPESLKLILPDGRLLENTDDVVHFVEAAAN